MEVQEEAAQNPISDSQPYTNHRAYTIQMRSEKYNRWRHEGLTLDLIVENPLVKEDFTTIIT